MATHTDRPARVAGVILAAGTSSRLGRPKQLLDFGGEPLVRRVARIALATNLDSVTIVLGAAARDIEPLLGDLSVVIVTNPDFARGQASSMQAGIRAVPADTDAILFLLGDQPTIEIATVNSVIDEFGHSGAAIVQAQYAGDVSGHPVLFSESLVPELMSIDGDEGGRGIIRRHHKAVRHVNFDQAPPPDIDTEEDYQHVLSRMNPGKKPGAML